MHSFALGPVGFDPVLNCGRSLRSMDSMVARGMELGIPIVFECFIQLKQYFFFEKYSWLYSPYLFLLHNNKRKGAISDSFENQYECVSKTI